MGPVVGAAGPAPSRRHEGHGALPAPLARGAELQLPRLRTDVQAEVLPAQPSEVGVRQRAPVPVPVLRVPRQAKDAYRTPYGEDASRSTHETRALREAGQRGRVHIARTILWILVTIQYSIFLK